MTRSLFGSLLPALTLTVTVAFTAASGATVSHDTAADGRLTGVSFQPGVTYSGGSGNTATPVPTPAP